MDPHAHGMVRAHTMMVLFRYLRCGRPLSIGPVHAGLQEYRPDFDGSELKHSIILWPVTRNLMLQYSEGIAAVISTICGVGYIEHRLLQQLVR